jgi:cell division protein FtsW (lipid II flippase)
MTTINTVLYILHVLSVIAILSLLLHQWNKEPRKLNPGILHAGLTALIAGLAMVGMFTTVHPDETLNHTKIAVKLLILLAILIIGYRNVKKPVLAKNTWLTLIGLTVTNILIASLW